jgi:hypothetical protein
MPQKEKARHCGHLAHVGEKSGSSKTKGRHMSVIDPRESTKICRGCNVRRSCARVYGVPPCAMQFLESAPSASTNSQSAEIIADIKVVVSSWFKHNDDLTHKECDILNSIAKCYKKAKLRAFGEPLGEILQVKVIIFGQ